MNWLKSQKPITETEHRSKSYAWTVMFGVSAGALAIYAADLVFAAITQNPDNVWHTGVMCATMAALGTWTAILLGAQSQRSRDAAAGQG